jgi:transcription elongation factor Elf1
MDMIKLTSVGKQGKCSRCGQEKIIVYNRVDPYSHQETNYCKVCFEFEYATVNCDLCGLEMVRKNLARHKLDAHTEKK